MNYLMLFIFIWQNTKQFSNYKSFQATWMICYSGNKKKSFINNPNNKKGILEWSVPSLFPSLSTGSMN